MAEPNTPKGPILSERLLLDGGNANVMGEEIDVNRERQYVRGLNAAKRAQLQTNVESWRLKNEKDVNAQGVVTLLESLKRDIKPVDETFQPNLTTPNSAAEAVSESVIGNGVMTSVEGYKDIPRYLRDEYSRFSNADTTEKKIGVAGKNVVFIGAIVAAYAAVHQGVSWMIDKLTPKDGVLNNVLHPVKWAASILGIGWLANGLIGKGNAANNKLATGALTNSTERVARTTAFDLNNLPPGKDLMDDLDLDDGAKTEKRVELNVNGTTVTILPPISDSGAFEMRMLVGGVPYRMVPTGGGENPVLNTITSLFQSADGRASFKAMKQNMKLQRNGDALRMSVFKGMGNVDVPMAEIARIVKELEGFPAVKPVTMEATFSSLATQPQKQTTGFLFERMDGARIAAQGTGQQAPNVAQGAPLVKPFEGNGKFTLRNGVEGITLNANGKLYTLGTDADGANSLMKYFNFGTVNDGTYRSSVGGPRFTIKETDRIMRLLAGSKLQETSIQATYEEPDAPGSTTFVPHVRTFVFSRVKPGVPQAVATPATAPAAKVETKKRPVIGNGRFQSIFDDAADGVLALNGRALQLYEPGGAGPMNAQFLDVQKSEGGYIYTGKGVRYKNDDYVKMLDTLSTDAREQPSIPGVRYEELDPTTKTYVPKTRTMNFERVPDVTVNANPSLAKAMKDTAPKGAAASAPANVPAQAPSAAPSEFRDITALKLSVDSKPVTFLMGPKGMVVEFSGKRYMLRDTEGKNIDATWTYLHATGGDKETIAVSGGKVIYKQGQFGDIFRALDKASSGFIDVPNVEYETEEGGKIVKKKRTLTFDYV